MGKSRENELAWILNSNDMEADDFIKELLILGLQKLFNRPENSDVIGQLAFFLSAGKKLMPFDEKKRRMQELVTATQIFKGSQSFKEKYEIPHFERAKGLLGQTNILISTSAPVEFFEFWCKEPSIFENKTFFLYGAVNTNEWLLGYILDHHKDLLLEFAEHPLLSKTEEAVRAIAEKDAKKPGAKPVDVAKRVHEALERVKAQLVMQKFMNAFQKTYCMENFPLWGAKGTASTSITMNAYPVTASHTKALFTKEATAIGKMMGEQVSEEATGVAKKQAVKIAGFIQYASEGAGLWEKLQAVFTQHGLDTSNKTPEQMLLSFDLLSDKVELMADLTKAFDAYCAECKIDRVEKTYGSGKESVSVEIYRAFSIWSRTAPYGYQILNADGMIAILLYELMRDENSRLLTPAFVPQALSGYDGSYTKFTPKTESRFYYPQTLQSDEAIQRLTLYLDVLMGQLLFAANKSLQPDATWMRVFAASGLDKVDPTDFSLVLQKDPALLQSLKKVFVTQDIALAKAFKQSLENEVKMVNSYLSSDERSGNIGTELGIFSSSSPALAPSQQLRTLADPKSVSLSNSM